MKIKDTEIQQLQEWLGARLGSLLSHGDRVRALLNAAEVPHNAPDQIITSAVDLVLGETKSEMPLLSPAQAQVWKTLLFSTIARSNLTFDSLHPLQSSGSTTYAKISRKITTAVTTVRQIEGRSLSYRQQNLLGVQFEAQRACSNNSSGSSCRRSLVL